MSDDLFFVPILEQALRQEDATSTLREAFARIRELGRQARYERGYRQFARFMQEAGEAEPHEAAEQVLGQFCQEFVRPDDVGILLEKDGTLLAKRSFQAAPGKQAIAGIQPGTYRLTFDTGRVLWEGIVTEEDVIWARAFPGEPLKMAAATGEDRAVPTKRLSLLGGSLVLQVFPGIERGTLEIEIVHP